MGVRCNVLKCRCVEGCGVIISYIAICLFNIKVTVLVSVLSSVHMGQCVQGEKIFCIILCKCAM